jgi:putative hydrolase of the HAD superfamily
LTRPRAVLFDAAETLFTTRGSVGEIYANIAHHYGSTASPEAVQAAFVRHFRGSGPVSIADQKQWWKEIVYHVFSEVGMVENFDEFFDRVYDQFRSSQGWMLFPETLEVLEQLRNLGVRLGIISNFDTRIYSVLDSLEIRRFFSAITTSSEAGFSKPDPQIFETAARGLGLPTSEILLVGDSLHDDIVPALQAGMTALLIDRRNRYNTEKQIRRISSLKEVIAEVTP